MPASVASSHSSRPEDLIGRLNSAQAPYEAKLKALRDLKNQIIGNRTKKVAFLKLGAVPSVVTILATSATATRMGGDGLDFHESFLIQSAAAIGSFACGLDAGVKAVLDAGAFPILFSLISHPNEKVVDASARSLKMIYQSKVAPVYDFLQEENMEYLLSLLNRDNENVTGLGASIITHSCQTIVQQQVLSDAGVIKRLVGLLGGTLLQRDASLESLAAVIKDNPEVASRFIGPENGRELSVVIELMKDKCPRTRLLACMCLINIRNASVSSIQDPGIKNKLVLILLELLDDPGQVGDEAPFVISNLISEKEDLHQLAFDANIVQKLCENLDNGSFRSKRFEGIFLALAGLCSKLECCRERVLKLKVIGYVKEALVHDSAQVRAAACIFLKNVSRSVKSMSAGIFMNEEIVVPLVQLLGSSCTCEQVVALGAISNVVVDFKADKSVFTQCGGVRQLVLLSKSIESSIRVNAVWALKNLTFLVNNRCKEEILLELSTSTLTSLISDPEASVQEKVLAFVRNLVDGTENSINYLFGEDALLLHSIGRQLRNNVKAEVLIQMKWHKNFVEDLFSVRGPLNVCTCFALDIELLRATALLSSCILHTLFSDHNRNCKAMYILSNVASGNEHHKEAVMSELFSEAGNITESIMVKFLQSSYSELRTAAVWAIVNLTLPNSPGACGRVTEFWNAGIVSQLKNMVEDPCLEVKLQTKTALRQLVTFGNPST